ncbi:MAG: type III secretion system chaperone [Rhizobiaceae bacterium]|nr:type III secretion system chaperone [Rhizobiaceae bacterium]
MSHHATINHWLRELSPADGGGFALDEDGVCLLVDTEGAVIRIEASEGNGRLYLVSHLAPVHGAVDASLMKMLLTANFLGLETNGTVLAIDERSAQIALCYSADVSHLDAQTLKTTIERFTDVRTTWSERISRHVASAVSSAPVHHIEHEAMMIRL